MENIPEDILLEVFKYLPQQDLIAAAESCELWADLIKTSTKLMKVLSIHYHSRHLNIPLPDGHHQNIIIEDYRHQNYPEHFDRIFDAFNTFQSSLRNVTLRDINMSQYSQYSMLLENLASLTTLKLENCRVKDTSYEFQQINAPNLRELEVNRCAWVFFKMFTNCHQIVSIKCENYLADSADENIFANFLENNRNLRRLMVVGAARGFLNSTNEFAFKLEKFTIDVVYFSQKSTSNRFIEFLISNRETLRELTVFNAPRDAIMKSILNDLLNLRRLEMGVTLLPDTLNFLHLIRKNYSLKTLILHGKLQAMDVVKGILQHYPGIETLKINHWSPSDIGDLLCIISESLPNLKSLKLPSLPGIISPIINFSKLNTLEIAELHHPSEVQNWTYLVIYSPNVSKLTVDKVEYGVMNNNNIGAVLSKAKMLREMCLGQSFEFNDQALNIIKNTARNLKILNIYTSCSESMRTMVERIHGDGLNCYIYQVNRDPLENNEIMILKVPVFNTITNYESYISRNFRRSNDNIPPERRNLIEHVRHVRDAMNEPNRDLLRRMRLRRFAIRRNRERNGNGAENGNQIQRQPNNPRNWRYLNFQQLENEMMEINWSDSDDNEVEVDNIQNRNGQGRN